MAPHGGCRDGSEVFLDDLDDQPHVTTLAEGDSLKGNRALLRNP
jgi:hypothetical protein